MTKRPDSRGDRATWGTGQRWEMIAADLEARGGGPGEVAPGTRPGAGWGRGATGDRATRGTGQQGGPGNKGGWATRGDGLGMKPLLTNHSTLEGPTSASGDNCRGGRPRGGEGPGDGVDRAVRAGIYRFPQPPAGPHRPGRRPRGKGRAAWGTGQHGGMGDRSTRGPGSTGGPKTSA